VLDKLHHYRLCEVSHKDHLFLLPFCDMRAAAILGIGTSPEDLKSFQVEATSFVLGVPAAANGLDAILIFGGDGTIHRHLSDLVRLQLPVLVVPRGSGNDFARSLELRDLMQAVAAWKHFVAGGNNVRAVDLGVITTPKQPQPHYFGCVAGVGLDTATARIANQLPRWLRGHGGYALSLPVALARFTPPHVDLLVSDSADGDKFKPHSSVPRVLAAFANTPWYGGGMRIAPQADMADGLLDACLIACFAGPLSKAKLLRLFPIVYSGKHLSFSEVEYFQGSRFQLTTQQPVDVYADGEFVCQTPVEISVAPHALRVIIPQVQK
jgi:diacylglycerol kinase (ATP)